jgi:glutamyl-Q tRNA(Asp) synthetase
VTLTTRFAPSPTGPLHLGHAFSALTAYHFAKKTQGRFILRIEDIDQGRCRPAFSQALVEDLAWLGLDWESPIRVQSQHMGDYHAALDHLRDLGLIYRCFKTRKAIADDIGRAPHGLDLPYRGQALSPDQEAEHMAMGHGFAWRLSLEAARRDLGDTFDDLTFIEDGQGIQAARPERAGDIVLARKDLGVAYHLAVVVDDALQGVTHVTRGQDLFEATGVQRLLQALLGLPAPTYCHHRLLIGPDGQRLAKRDRAQTLRALRDSGVKPDDLRRQLGFD